MYTVAVLAMNGLVPLDTAIPCDLFGRIRQPQPAKEITPNLSTLLVPAG
jgi:hypothetical protein